MTGNEIQTLIMRANREHEVWWLDDLERYEWSMRSDVACVVATEETGLYAYMNGIKYDEHGGIVGELVPNIRAGRIS